MRERKVPTTALSERAEKVLVVLLDHYESDRSEGGYYGMTGNEIGYAVVGRNAPLITAHKGWHGNAVMGPAQRVISTLISLDRRALVRLAARRDHRSGTAYALTTEGVEVARKLREERKMDDSALAVKDGYDAENLALVTVGDATFAPGEFVTISDDHEIYPGERGEVLAVGRHNAWGSTLLYDILIDGTSDAERFAEHEIAEAT